MGDSTCKNEKGKNHQKNEDNTAINPGTVKLINETGENYRKKNYLKAYEGFLLLVQLDSTNGEYYYKKAYCESQLRYSTLQEIEDWRKAIELNYKKADSYYNMALCYLMLNEDSIGILHLKNCLREDSNYKDARDLMAKLENIK